MRTTITLDDQLLADAKSYTGVQKTATLIRMGLTLLVQREAARRLILLGGSDPNASLPPREGTEG